MIRNVAILGILVFIIVLSACKGDAGSPANEAADESKEVPANLEMIEHKDDYGYTEKYYRRKSDFAKEGKYVRRNEAGKIVETAEYTNDTLNGVRVIFYESGDTQYVERYKMGLFVGPYEVYYQNGHMAQRGQYIDNAMQGIWLRYYDTGELMEEVTFVDNEENGPFREYHKNGQLKAEGAYRNGDNEEGPLKLYDEEGELIKEMDCKYGICKTVWEKK